MTSKYASLGEHVAAIGAVTITLSFAEIEAVVGPLPDAARFQAAWWGATPTSGRWYLHTYAWRDAGYVADRPDFAAQTVTFRRRVR